MVSTPGTRVAARHCRCSWLRCSEDVCTIPAQSSSPTCNGSRRDLRLHRYPAPDCRCRCQAEILALTILARIAARMGSSHRRQATCPTGQLSVQELLQQGFLPGTCTCNLVQDTGAGTKAAYNRCRLVSALVQLRRRRPCCNETCTDICNGGQQPLPPVSPCLRWVQLGLPAGRAQFTRRRPQRLSTQLWPAARQRGRRVPHRLEWHWTKMRPAPTPPYALPSKDKMTAPCTKCCSPTSTRTSKLLSARKNKVLNRTITPKPSMTGRM